MLNFLMPYSREFKTNASITSNVTAGELDTPQFPEKNSLLIVESYWLLGSIEIDFRIKNCPWTTFFGPTKLSVVPAMTPKKAQYLDRQIFPANSTKLIPSIFLLIPSGNRFPQ